MTIPKQEQCLDILNEYGTPEIVVAHCIAVSRVAILLGTALNRNGYKIDIDLLRAASLLHDIARTSDEHEKIGGEYLRDKGYENIADIVEKHTKYMTFNKVSNIKEIDLLCIADRVVKEDEYVGVDERMEYIKAKAIYMGRPEFADKIEKGKDELKAYILQIEKVIGTPLDTLVRGTYE